MNPGTSGVCHCSLSKRAAKWLLALLLQKQRGLNMQNTGRGSQGLKYARSDEEAEQILSESEEYFLLNGDEQRAARAVAMNVNKGGIKAAVDFIGNTLVQARATVNRNARQNQVDPILLANTNTFAGLSAIIFKAAASGYVSLTENVSVGGGPYSMEVILQALDEWRQEGDSIDQHITNVHVFEPENKAAQGKGNVGATLATRNWQANVISTWFGRRVNVHIDLDKKDIPR